MVRLRFQAVALLLLGAVAGTLTAYGADAAPTSSYQQGKQYELVSTPAAPPDAKKVTVQEFFSYGCPHCFAFDPTMETWLKHKPDYVSFERVPMGLGRPEWDTLSRAFYVAQLLGISDKIHKPLFDAIHQQNLPLYTLPNLRIFFARTAGVSPSDFDDVASSFAVDNLLRRADGLSRTDGIISVPTVIIDGKYTTDYIKAGSFPETPKVMDFLIEKSRKERKL